MAADGVNPSGRSKQLTAVLIDDMVEIRLLLRLALEEVGVEVVGEAGDGAAGVEVAIACKPDLVILDVSMPVMDGLTALPMIRAALADTKIIVLSAFDRALCEGSALSNGADAYVEKGQVELFLATVRDLGGLEANWPADPSSGVPEPREGRSRVGYGESGE